MANKIGYNLTADTKEYSRYFGNFRGVDFSSDHTQVADTRFSYLVNMYKDYRNGQGGGVETFPGYRKIPLEIDAATELTDIGDIKLVHVGGYKLPVFIILGTELDGYGERTLAIAYKNNGKFIVSYGEIAEHGTERYKQQGDHIVCFEFEESAYVLTNRGILKISYESHAYSFSKLYAGDVYVPTTYANIPAGNSFSSSAKDYENEQRNLVSNKEINTFVGDGTSKDFYPLSRGLDADAFIQETKSESITTEEETDAITLTTTEIENISVRTLFIDEVPIKKEFYSVSVGEAYLDVSDLLQKRNITVTLEKEIPANSEVKLDFDVLSEEVTQISRDSEGYVEYITFALAPANGKIVKVELRIENEDTETQFTQNNAKILGCTIATVYDNRVFLSGNPAYPNIVWWCGIPDDGSGLPDPTYWGELNYVRDGIGSSPIMGMFPVADTLCVLKSDTIQDGVVYYHSPSIQDGNNITPVTYPSVRGLSGQGLIAKNGCANFRDDPVFITAQGLDAIGQLSVRYERATEHRSSLIDTKLRQSDLTSARLAVWNGYLILYTADGKAFLADSRATYGNGDHNEYEWYYLEDLGAYDEQSDAVRYGDKIPSEIANVPIGTDGKLELADPQLFGKIAGYVSQTGDITTASVAIGADTPDEYTFNYAYKTVEDAYGKAHYYYCEYTDFVFDEVRYASQIPEDLITPEGITLELADSKMIGNIAGSVGDGYVVAVTIPDNDFDYAYKVFVDESETTHYYYCEYVDAVREQTGGTFHPATAFLPDGEDLYMATQIGLFKFNFDLRESDSSFYPYKDGILTYARNNRAYVSGCATKMDNCGIPHLVKTTSKKSLVIKTRSEYPATMKVKVRTNRDEYKLVDRLSDSNMDFTILDFADLAFTSTPRSIFAVSEKEKKWVEKQYYAYNDEFNKNFCLVYIAYRYSVSGKYKNK